MHDRMTLAAGCLADPAAGRHPESRSVQPPGRLIDCIPSAMASRLRLADFGDRS
ncbi:hypothetical protein [Thiobacillus sp.]